MPTEKGVGLEDKQSFLPILDATGEENKPKTIRLRKGGLFDLAMNAKRNKLLAKKSILGDQVRLGASQVGDGTENYRMPGRLSEMQKSLFIEENEPAEQ